VKTAKAKSKTAQVREFLAKNPNAKAKDVAMKFGVSAPVVYVVLRHIREQAEKIAQEEAAQAPVEAPVQQEEVSTTLTVHEGGGIVAILTERGDRYGKFSGHAKITQDIKRAMSEHARLHNKTFTDSQWESLEMIAHKIGRIVNGDPDHVDSWVDIAGYAQLVADELQGVER
jgi:hypothetical protein